MYIGFHDRLVDEGGLNFWSNVFDNATNKRQTAISMSQGIVRSGEFLSKKPTFETIVVRLYRALLGRFPADNEIAHWAGELYAGRQTVDNLINLFANSQEFTQILDTYFSL